MRRMAYVFTCPTFSVPHHFLTANPQFPITALREIKLLKLLSHKNILRLEDMAVEHPPRGCKLTLCVAYMPAQLSVTNLRRSR